MTFNDAYAIAQANLAAIKSAETLGPEHVERLAQLLSDLTDELRTRFESEPAAAPRPPRKPRQPRG